MKNTVTRILNYEQIEVDGFLFERTADQDLKPGDTYIGERNVGPRVGFVERVAVGAIYGIPLVGPPMYPYDKWECVKVQVVDEEALYAWT